jgi:hypothetical protein
MSDTRLTLRFYSDRDNELIEWLESVPDRYGAKSEAVKNLLRLGLAVSQEGSEPNAPALSGLDADALQSLGEIIEILPDKMLPDIRKVVESVVRTELGKISIIGPEQPKDGDEEESEAIEDMLSAMESELVDGQI